MTANVMNTSKTNDVIKRNLLIYTSSVKNEIICQ